ncbi:SMC5-SMC6 complex localization factor protein 2 isoform X2 [Electrophorus electricus]|uniref:SMC5-SMC6 complex localization factor protein 2 isoform X2 n=1 Tax=Electrophorus electricus TaxID=8005 RepID=UPI0015D0ADA9|nr:SMC5-SMC6 complex localization factor protein 2 isoform X2 [Electrophorus electricus]
MKSNLKQQITSMVKDIIPLGVSRRYSADDATTTNLVVHCSSQETHQKLACTLHNMNPPSKLMLPIKRSVPEQRSTSAVATSSGSKKCSKGGQDALSSHNTLRRKPQLSNRRNQSSEDGSLHSAAKKDAPGRSYSHERDFSLALCKQLNENLKVGKVMLSQSPQHQRACESKTSISRPVNDSHSSSVPQSETRIPGTSMEKWDLQATGKMDKQLNGDRSTPIFSPVSSHRGEGIPCQATTPGGRSRSLKRQREGSTERTSETERLCEENNRLILNSPSSSLSPQYIKRVCLRTSSAPVGHKYSPIPERLSFKEPSREPRSESCKPQTVTRTTEVLRKDHLKKGIETSIESRCSINNPLTSDLFPSTSSKTSQNCNNEGHSPASSHTSSLSSLMDEDKTSLFPYKLKPTVPGFPELTESSRGDVDEEKKTTSRASLCSVTVKQDTAEKRALVWKDPLDLELVDERGLGLDTCSLSLSSSNSSEEEKLLSLQEILERSAHVPATPEKGAFSEPSTPLPKAPAEDVKKKPTSYKNTLEQMLIEKKQDQKSKELEMQLLEACKEDLLKLEEENENLEDALSHEQRQFLDRFSVPSCAIRDLHPGEDIFTLANFGRIFNHQSLDLRQIGVTPTNRAQQTLLQAHPEQVLLLLSAGLLRRAYCSSPCHSQVTRWLFQMMSVHPHGIACAQILQAMTTIALTAAQQIVEKSSKMFEVWVPSIQDIGLVFLNMGVPFVSLFPLDAPQPPFTEGDLLESIQIHPDGARTENKRDSFPEHNFENIIKYLALCAALCPRAYTDEELLLLVTVVCRVSLETSLQLFPTGDISCLLQHILNNMTNWETMLPQLCQAITDLTDDHHNLRRLVQLLPHERRGKQLRRHLSVSVISKLLNHRCTYLPSSTEFELSALRCYLPRMRPSTLLKGIMAAKKEQQDVEDCTTTPDQQAYYLCYSLLALTNEASNFEFLPSAQRNELQLLSAELEKHIKCDIRESEKMLYRSKVKDFVARIYTRWQVLLQRSRPQEGKLYDYWKPLPEDEVPINQERELTEGLKQETTEESQSGDSENDESEEQWGEEDEVLMESTEEQEESAGELDEEKGEMDEVRGDIKEDECMVMLDDENGVKEGHKTPVDEDLLGGSLDELMEDVDDELFQIEDELLKDEESLERDVDSVEGGPEESQEMGILEDAN